MEEELNDNLMNNNENVVNNSKIINDKLKSESKKSELFLTPLKVFF